MSIFSKARESRGTQTAEEISRFGALPDEKSSGGMPKAISKNLEECEIAKEKDLSFKVGAATSIGPREKNDDYYKLDHELQAIALSDGIGGAPYGDVVSRIGCRVSLDVLRNTKDSLLAFYYANSIANQVLRWMDCEKEGSGATLLLAVYEDRSLCCLNAGDSVAAILRDGVMDLINVRERDSRTGRLLSGIGFGFEIYPTRERIELSPGDRILFCTDGVWDALSNVEIAGLISAGENAPLIADSIVNAAVRVGTDNATAVVLLVD